MFHQPIRRPQPPSRLNTLPLRQKFSWLHKLPLLSRLYISWHRNLSTSKPKNIQRIYEAIEQENREKIEKKMSKVCNEAVPFNVMYYHALIKEIVKEFTKQSKQVGQAFQINIFYSEHQTVFILTKKFAINGIPRSTSCISIKIRIPNG